jgi:hypothetical protein
MRTTDFRWTIRQTIWWVILAALWCGVWVYFQRWEARRKIMYQQQDVTRSIVLEAKQEIVATGHLASEIRIERPVGTYTAKWTEWFEASENRTGQKLSLIRATVSGDNGRFSLQPIIVETYGSKLDAAWLDRLPRTYREKGWRYKVIQGVESEYSRKHQEWIRNDKTGVLSERAP